MTHDVLDLDDRVVDQNAGHQRDREQAHQIEREADRVHRPEGRNDRERQRDRGDDRRAQITQEDEHHDDRKQRAFDQGLHRRAVVAELVVDLRVDLGEGHLGVLGGNFREPLLDQLIDGHVARALGPLDAEGDNRLVKEAGEGARLGGAVDNRPEFVEPDFAPARQRDRQRREIGDAARARKRSDRLFLAGDLAAAAAEIDIVGAYLLIDGGRGDAERQQLFRIEGDADLSVDAAGALDLADATNALQVARDRIVDEPRQLLDAEARRRSGVSDDRQALDVDAVDDRLVDGARQIAANLGDLILHVVERAIDVDRADVELHDGRRRAVGDGRNKMPDAVEARDGVIDLFRHLLFELRRRCARLGDQHLYDRDVDIGKAGNRHRPKADEAEDGEDREGHHRGDGAADRPG